MTKQTLKRSPSEEFFIKAGGAMSAGTLALGVAVHSLNSNGDFGMTMLAIAATAYSVLSGASTVLALADTPEKRNARRIADRVKKYEQISSRHLLPVR